MSIVIRPYTAADPEKITATYKQLNWEQPIDKYLRYLKEHESGERRVFVAEFDGGFAGYVTVVRKSGYLPFLEAGVPEIVDFSVLTKLRRRGIGSRLMDEAEKFISELSPIAGIGVGLHLHYGSAQRMYVKRGYIPDGRGVTYRGEVAPMGATVRNDDDLVLHFTKQLR